MSGLPYIVCSGDPRERGLAHGRQLKDRIHKTYSFYEQAIFRNSSLSTEQIKARAAQLAMLIKDFQQDFVTEIDAIAEGADIDSWKIYALNARTEILNAPVAECTSLYFQDTALLGQTWDWIRELEELVVIARYEYSDGRIITALTEPGMLAKIGLNNSGLGVCLNFLVSSHELDGVPVHITLRAILESVTINEAREKIERSGRGKSSHFLVADADGQCFGMEFAAGNCSEIGLQEGVLVHTNHCIGQNIESTMIPTSAERLTKARQHLSSLDTHTIEDMQNILLDDSQGHESIQSNYHAEELLGGLEVGTCATIIMDLQRLKLYARKGPGTERDFQCFE
jgi:isopenicillin-N N-acyltransferase like protein